jgi:ribonuclease HII
MPSNLHIDGQAIINGDNLSISIAAASIVAKVLRDRMVMAYHEEYPMYGWDRNKGYGTKEHVEAIKKFGITPYHRKSFRGVKEFV